MEKVRSSPNSSYKPYKHIMLLVTLQVKTKINEIIVGFRNTIEYKSSGLRLKTATKQQGGLS